MTPPNIWGPIFWKLLHNITTLYPNNPTLQDKDNFINFINSFKNLLPCKECREHFVHNLNILPLSDYILSSKYNVILWGISIHNIVRKMLNKSIYYKETIEYVQNEIKKNKNISTKNILGNAMHISLSEITLNYKLSQSDFYIIFNMVNYFLMQNDINLETFFNNKKIKISFDKKADALRIANYLL